MFVDLLFYLFIIASIIDISHICMYLTGANLYDMLYSRRAFKEQKLLQTIAAQPLVSVLIPAHNEELSIIRCLDSVLASLYRNIEIIVIDDASKDSTRRLVQKYIRAHPGSNVRIAWKSKNVGKAAALNHALQHKVRGDLVMTLDADSVLAETTVGNAVRHFNDPSVVGVAANVRVMSSSSLMNLLQTFEYLISYRSKKFYSITNSEFVIGGVASTYRMSTLRSVGFYDDDILTEDIGLSLKIISAGNKRNRIVYGADVVAMTEGVQTFRALLRQRYRWKMGNMQCLVKYSFLFANPSRRYSLALTMYRIPMAYLGEVLVLLQPLILGFIIYICLQSMSTGLVFGAYLTISAYILWNLLHDEHSGVLVKLKLMAFVPLMYFISYSLNIVQLYAVIRCVLNPRQVRRRSDITNRWKSPERSGEQVVQFS